MRSAWSSPWSVVVLAILIAIIQLAGSGFGTDQGKRMGVALVILLLIGFLWPPLGILFGGIALLYLVFTKGPALIKQLTSGVSNGGTSAP